MIYFIQAGSDGPVKIGYTASPANRAAALQTNHYSELTVLREIPGNKNTERWLHAHFKMLKVRGEWFKYDPTMLTIMPPRAPKIDSFKTAMTSEELREIGVTLWGEWGWQTRMAENLGLDGRTIRHYVAGTLPVSGPVAVALRLLKQHT